MNFYPVKNNPANYYLLQESVQYTQQLMLGLAMLQRIPGLSYQYNLRKLVFQIDKIKLYHYQPQTKKPNATPLLVVFATVNRPEILDLFPEHSFIRGLLEGGQDVYLLDWGYPDLTDKEITF